MIDNPFSPDVDSHVDFLEGDDAAGGDQDFDAAASQKAFAESALGGPAATEISESPEMDPVAAIGNQLKINIADTVLDAIEDAGVIVDTVEPKYVGGKEESDGEPNVFTDPHCRLHTDVTGIAGDALTMEVSLLDDLLGLDPSGYPMSKSIRKPPGRMDTPLSYSLPGRTGLFVLNLPQYQETPDPENPVYDTYAVSVDYTPAPVSQYDAHAVSSLNRGVKEATRTALTNLLNGTADYAAVQQGYRDTLAEVAAEQAAPPPSEGPSA